MMKALILFISILFSALICHSQQIMVDVGRTSTQFDYLDSDKEGIENLYPSRHFSYAAGYRKSIGNRVFAGASILFNRYGMYGSDRLYDNQYQWDVSYLGLGLALDLEVFKYRELRVFGRLGVDPEFMINGTQTINNQVFDLKGVEQFDKPFLFLRGGVGAMYCADERVAVVAKYMYGKGLPMGKSEDGERLRLNSHTFSIGLAVSLKYCSYCYKTHFKKD